MRTRVWAERKRLLRSEAEQLGYKSCFGHHVFLCDPSHASFPNPVDGFDALQGSPGTRERFVAFGQPDSLFRNSMILFDHMIQEFTLP